MKPAGSRSSTATTSTGGFDRIVADNSSYYVLALLPAGSRGRAATHRIQVRVTRPGVTVRARKVHHAEESGSRRRRGVHRTHAAGAA